MKHHGLQPTSGTEFPTAIGVGQIFYIKGVGGSPYDDGLYVYNGTGWQLLASGTINYTEITASGGSPAQTEFTATYNPDNVHVFLNGVLLSTTDYTATNGTSIILNEAAVENDIVAVSSGTVEDLSAGLRNIVEDTTPQLGGDLDMNGFKVSTNMTVQNTAGGSITSSYVQTPSFGGSAFVSFLNSTGSIKAQFGLLEASSDEMRVFAGGGELSLITSQGENINIIPGDSNNTSGGSVIIAGSNHVLTADQDGGDITLTGGTTVGGSPFTAGNITLTGGEASVLGSFPGNISIYGGGAAGSNTVTGGQILIIGGAGVSLGSGGDTVIQGGQAASGTGGSVQINGGSGFSGGNVTLTPGASFGAIEIDGPTSTEAGGINFNEGSTNGSGYVRLVSPDSITTSRTVTLPQNNPDEGDVLINDGTGVTSWASTGGRKNLIINGCMRVWQRNTLFTVASPAGTFTADRWAWTVSGTSTVTWARQVTPITTSGLNAGYYLFGNVTAADAALLSTEFAVMITKIEGQDLNELQWGGARAKTVTLSFWHAHTLTGTYCVALRNKANDRSWVSEYTQSVSGAWEKTIITITGPTDGVWEINNTTGLQVLFAVDSGTNSETASTDQWLSADKFTTANQVNALSSTANWFRFTSIQLEVGEEATQFEHRPMELETVLCMRYYEHSYNNAIAVGTVTNVGADGLVLFGLNTATHAIGQTVGFRATKRATPTVTVYSPGTGTAGQAYENNEGADKAVTLTFEGQSGFRWHAVSSSRTNTDFRVHWRAVSEL